VDCPTHETPKTKCYTNKNDFKLIKAVVNYIQANDQWTVGNDSHFLSLFVFWC